MQRHREELVCGAVEWDVHQPRSVGVCGAVEWDVHQPRSICEPCLVPVSDSLNTSRELVSSSILRVDPVKLCNFDARSSDGVLTRQDDSTLPTGARLCLDCCLVSLSRFWSDDVEGDDGHVVVDSLQHNQFIAVIYMCLKVLL